MVTSAQFRGIILCDIDETLIDTAYKLTVSHEMFRTILQQAQDAGFAIGLNSDTAMQALVARAREFGINGPLIGERGALLTHCVADVPIFSAPTGLHLENTMRNILTLFIRRLLARNDCSLVFDNVGNITTMLGRCAPPSRPIRVFINDERRCSVGFWIRDARNGKSEKNPNISQNIVDELMMAAQTAGIDAASLDIDNNPDYGICIAHHRDTQKSLAVQTLFDNSPITAIYMIGNSMSDFLNHLSVIQCAVGNAKKAYKDRCTIVAKHQLSEGVIEIIEHIIRESN